MVATYGRAIDSLSFAAVGVAELHLLLGLAERPEKVL
jgi:hypothetical protein